MRHASSAVLGPDVRSSVAELRALLSDAAAHDAIVVERQVNRDADQVRRIFVQGLVEQVDAAAWAGFRDTATAGKVHGLVRFGGAWTEADGSLCRHFWLCSDPTTVIDTLRCLGHPRLRGQVRLAAGRGGTQRLTVTGWAQEPDSRIGRLLADANSWEPTAATWVARLAEVLSAQLERGPAGSGEDPDAVDILRFPLPGGTGTAGPA